MGTNMTQVEQRRDAEDNRPSTGQGFSADHQDRDHRKVLLVKPEFPVNNLPEFLNYARVHNLTAGYRQVCCQ